jgi:hypothetical protein
MTERKTSVEMTDEDALLFVWVQQNWDKLNVLKEVGVFGTKNGSITLHFDALGMLMLIESNKIEFKRTRVINGTMIKI